MTPGEANPTGMRPKMKGRVCYGLPKIMRGDLSVMEINGAEILGGSG